MKGLAIAVLGVGLAAGCGGEGLGPIPTIEVQGAPIDGSEDPRAADVSVPVPVPAPQSGAETETGRETRTGTDADTDAVAITGTKTKTKTETESETKTETETEVAASSAEKVDLTFRALSLLDYDVDAMLDYMLFPAEYEGEDTSFLELPADLKALDGKQISIVGYMIPGQMERGNVRDFMLVRDLMGCCFGGTPMPDEWIDVTMDEGAKAEYRPYMPMRVTGVLSLSGQQDGAGFALGIYRLRGSAVQVED